jgi:basic membrane protein A
VPNYIVGYENGAKSVNPDIQVHTVYLSAAPDAKAFNDPAEGNLQTTQLMSLYPGIDVVFQVAGKSGNGALQAACDAGIYGIGVDVDQFVSTPEYDKCIVVSAEKKLKKNVSDMIVKAAAGELPAGGIKLDITTDDVGLSSFHDFQDLVTPELQSALDAATAGLKDGSVQACELTPFQSCVVPAQ